MSCLHKRPKRTKLQEEAFQEQVKKVAQENGKRLGESPPLKKVWISFRAEQSDTRARINMLMMYTCTPNVKITRFLIFVGLQGNSPVCVAGRVKNV